MTSAAFYKLVLTLWGEGWRKELRKLLATHGLCYTRQTFWNWQHGHSPVPEEVEAILKAEKQRLKWKGNVK